MNIEDPPARFQPDRRVGQRTNGERADGAHRALASFARELGDLSFEDALQDFISDSMHLASKFGYNPVELLDRLIPEARRSFVAENYLEPHEGGDEEPPNAEVEDDSDWQESAPRYFVCKGRIPGSDEDELVVLQAQSQEEAYKEFVELTLYGGNVWPRDEYLEKGERWSLPTDWQDTTPEESHNPHEEWAYVDIIEVGGPAIDG